MLPGRNLLTRHISRDPSLSAVTVLRSGIADPLIDAAPIFPREWLGRFESSFSARTTVSSETERPYLIYHTRLVALTATNLIANSVRACGRSQLSRLLAAAHRALFDSPTFSMFLLWCWMFFVNFSFSFSRSPLGLFASSLLLARRYFVWHGVSRCRSPPGLGLSTLDSTAHARAHTLGNPPVRSFFLVSIRVR